MNTKSKPKEFAHPTRRELIASVFLAGCGSSLSIATWGQTVSADLKGSHCGRLGCEPEMSAMMAGNTSALTAVRNKQSWFRDFSPRAKVSSWALLPRRPLQA